MTNCKMVLFPHFQIALDDAQAIVRHLTRFAVAGLAAVAKMVAPLPTS